MFSWLQNKVKFITSGMNKETRELITVVLLALIVGSITAILIWGFLEMAEW